MVSDAEEINQFNSEISSDLEDLQEAVHSVNLRLENGITPDEAIETLDEKYRNFSKIQRTLEAGDEPEEALKTPEPTGEKPGFEPKDEGLKASRKKLSDHHQHIVNQIELTLQEAEEVYQKYREQKGLQRIDDKYDLRSMFKDFENGFEALSWDVQIYRNYIRVLKDVKEGERDSSETDFSIPENKNEIDQQISKGKERIYSSIEEIQSKKQEVEEAFQELREDYEAGGKAPAIKIGIKYGIKMEKVESYKRWLDGLEEDLKGIRSSALKQLQEYTEM